MRRFMAVALAGGLLLASLPGRALADDHAVRNRWAGAAIGAGALALGTLIVSGMTSAPAPRYAPPPVVYAPPPVVYAPPPVVYGPPHVVVRPPVVVHRPPVRYYGYGYGHGRWERQRQENHGWYRR